MTDSISTILENTRALLLKELAMMETGTMTVRHQGKDATKETIAEYRLTVSELDGAISRHGRRNA